MLHLVRCVVTVGAAIKHLQDNDPNVQLVAVDVLSRVARKGDKNAIAALVLQLTGHAVKDPTQPGAFVNGADPQKRSLGSKTPTLLSSPCEPTHVAVTALFKGLTTAAPIEVLQTNAHACYRHVSSLSTHGKTARRSLLSTSTAASRHGRTRARSYLR